MDTYQDGISLSNYFQQCYIAPLRVETNKQERHLTEQVKKSLLPHLPDKKDVVELTAIIGDYEAFQFANEIKDFLEKEGYNTEEVINQSVFSQPIKGQLVEPRKQGGVRIIIGRA